MEIFDSPILYAAAAVIGFFLKDLFNRIQRTSDMKTELNVLKDRVTALEVSHKEFIEMGKAITRLEEQVKNLTENIKLLIERAK